MLASRPASAAIPSEGPSAKSSLSGLSPLNRTLSARIAKIGKTMIGPQPRSANSGLSTFKMRRLMNTKPRYPNSPPSRGETTQLAAILPMTAQFTALKPPAIKPKPTTAPTMLCVVDTGQPE